MGTVAALAEGVMDMMVRPLPRSQHSNPQALLEPERGAREPWCPPSRCSSSGRGHGDVPLPSAKPGAAGAEGEQPESE